MKPPRFRSTILAVVLVGLGVVEAFLFFKRYRYSDETARLRADMSVIERERTDAIIDAENDRMDLMLQLIQRQAIGDDALHLAVSSDSSFVALDRGEIRLRVMPATFGAPHRVGVSPDTMLVTVPLGMRRVEKVLTEKDAYELPSWLFADRQMPEPENRAVAGWVGADAIVTSGGTVLYSTPSAGPLADSSYVMPGAIRLSKADLAAIRENITLGMRVYFY